MDELTGTYPTPPVSPCDLIVGASTCDRPATTELETDMPETGKPGRVALCAEHVLAIAGGGSFGAVVRPKVDEGTSADG